MHFRGAWWVISTHPECIGRGEGPAKGPSGPLIFWVSFFTRSFSALMEFWTRLFHVEQFCAKLRLWIPYLPRKAGQICGTQVGEICKLFHVEQFASRAHNAGKTLVKRICWKWVGCRGLELRKNWAVCAWEIFVAATFVYAIVFWGSGRAVSIGKR